ncbi:MAG: hypothetical protein J6U25_02205 [Clostridia bacterium]|nr:hypothetical protein [Clostridia bacterium]
MGEEIEKVNAICGGAHVACITYKTYGDLIIRLSNGVVIEIINDTHLEDAIVFNVEDFKEKKEICLFVENEKIRIKDYS